MQVSRQPVSTAQGGGRRRDLAKFSFLPDNSCTLRVWTDTMQHSAVSNVKNSGHGMIVLSVLIFLNFADGA
jgi:hypothetical protein